MSVPPSTDDRDRAPGGRRPPPEPDPLDEPDDLLAPEDGGDQPDDGPEPAPTDLGDEPLDEDPALPEPPGVEGAPSPWEGEPTDDEPSDDADPGEEPAPIGLDDDPFPLEDTADAPSLDESESPGEDPHGWEDPDEDPDGEDLGEDDWAAMESDERGLVPGRVVVGLKEFAALPDLGVGEIVARFDTGSDRSRLACARGADGGLIVGGQAVGAAAEEGRLRTRVSVAGCVRTLALEVVAEGTEPPLVLGRDALEGYFVVDVALAFLHPRGPVRG